MSGAFDLRREGLVVPVGFEPDSGKATNPGVLTHSPIEAVRNPVQSGKAAPFDPDLVALIQAWPTLPPAIRQAVSSIVSVHATASPEGHGLRNTPQPERDLDELPPGYEQRASAASR